MSSSKVTERTAKAARSRPLVIDARAQIEGAPVALETAHEQPLLEHLLRYVLTACDGEVSVVAEPEQVEAIRASVDRLRRQLGAACRVEVSAQGFPADAVHLRADTLYDLPRLRRALLSGGDPQREALWRITARADLPRAGAEIARAIEWYPISRWYLRRAARRLARTCGLRGVSPNCLTWSGFTLAVLAAMALPLAVRPELGLGLWVQLAVAGLLLGYWLLDQADGYLARLSGSVSAYGGWLDANLDELVDLGLHVAAGWALTLASGSVVPLWLVVGFLVGKYLFMYGLNFASEAEPRPAQGCEPAAHRGKGAWSVVRRLWHFPADADVRLHLLVVAVAVGQLGIELAFVAIYYNLRWVARHVLMAHRATRPAGNAHGL